MNKNVRRLLLFVLFAGTAGLLHAGVPTPEQLDRIVGLVSEGRYAEAKASAEILLTVYPGNAELTEIIATLNGVLEEREPEKPVKEAEVPTPPAQPVPPAPVSRLSADDLLELNTIVFAVQECFQIEDKAERAQRLKPVLERPVWKNAESSDDPQWLSFWKARALAALDLEDERSARVAGHHLRRLGALDSTDPAVMRLLVQLNQRDLLRPFYAKLTISSDVPSCAVYLDGERIGETPVLFEHVPEGREMQFTLMAPGHLPRMWNWVPKGGADHREEVVLTPDPADGSGYPTVSVDEIRYFVESCRAPSMEVGGTEDDKAFRMAQGYLAYARMGDYERARRYLDADKDSGWLSANLHGYFMQQLAIILIDHGRIDEAMVMARNSALFPEQWHLRELARYIVENCMKFNRADVAPAALDIAFTAQEASVSATGGDAWLPLNRCSQYSSLALSAITAYQYDKARRYLSTAEMYAASIPGADQVMGWSWIGQHYARLGDLDAAIRALGNMTGGEYTIPAMAYLGWKLAIGIRLESYDEKGAETLLKAARKAIAQASRRFKSISKSASKDEFPDSLLKGDAFASAIRMENPEQALALYTSEGRNLRFNNADFSEILELFLKKGMLGEAEAMVMDPKLGLFEPTDDDRKETEWTLAFSRARVAGELLAHKSLAAHREFAGQFEATPTLRYNLALQSAYSLANRTQNSKK